MTRRTYIKEFSGKRILVVEGEYLLIDEARQILRHLGAVVVSLAGQTQEALELLGPEKPDAAILDIQLENEFTFSLVEKLEALGIPFVFAIGFNPSILPGRYTGFALCTHPARLETIARTLFSPLAKRATASHRGEN